MRCRYNVRAALDINGCRAVRAGGQRLRCRAALRVRRREGDGRTRNRQTEIIDHGSRQRVSGNVVDTQRRALTLAHHKNRNPRRMRRSCRMPQPQTC